MNSIKDPALDLTMPLLGTVAMLKPGMAVIQADGTTVRVVLSVEPDFAHASSTVHYVGGLTVTMPNADGVEVTRLSSMAVYHARQSERAVGVALSSLAEKWEAEAAEGGQTNYASYDDCAAELRGILNRCAIQPLERGPMHTDRPKNMVVEHIRTEVAGYTPYAEETNVGRVLLGWVHTLLTHVDALESSLDNAASVVRNTNIASGNARVGQQTGHTPGTEDTPGSEPTGGYYAWGIAVDGGHFYGRVTHESAERLTMLAERRGFPAGHDTGAPFQPRKMDMVPGTLRRRMSDLPENVG